MKCLFKYSIISLLCMISFCLQAQTDSDQQARISFQTGYVKGSGGGSSSYGINDGMQFKLSSDWKIANSSKWFAGFGLNYLRTSIDHLAPQSIGLDAYSLTFRGGWEAPIAHNLLLRGVIESGPAYMQSRHQYDGARYKTHKPTVMLGNDVLFKEENVKVDRITGHGGLFKTPGVGQKVLAAALNSPISVMETAGEGGAWGIALLAAYCINNPDKLSLADYLEQVVFAGNTGVEIAPDPEDVEGFNQYIKTYGACIPVVQSACDHKA